MIKVAPLHLLLVNSSSMIIILVTKVEPILLDDLLVGAVIVSLRVVVVVVWCFGEDDCKTSFKMPVDVTVQEPSSWIIGLETNDHSAPSNTNDIATGRVLVVQSDAVARLDNVERMPMQMERMSDPVECTMNVQLNNLIARYDERIL